MRYEKMGIRGGQCGGEGPQESTISECWRQQHLVCALFQMNTCGKGYQGEHKPLQTLQGCTGVAPPFHHETGMFGKISAFQNTDLILRLHIRENLRFYYCFYSTHRQLDDFVEEELFVSKEVKHKILMDEKEAGKQSSDIKQTERLIELNHEFLQFTSL